MESAGVPQQRRFRPSFFHDDDGRHWLVALEWDPRDGYEHPGAIVLEEYDAEHARTGRPNHPHLPGRHRPGMPGGAHLYQRNGFYYLMAAEGGTGYGHGVTLARSRDIAGPYQPGPVNPFITSNPARISAGTIMTICARSSTTPTWICRRRDTDRLVETPTGEW